jgi:Ala-tRNA(Pro) deacylase
LTLPDLYTVLDELGISYDKYEHPPVYTVEQADRLRGKLPGGQTKNLFLRNKKGKRHYLVVTASNKQVDLKQLREHCGEKVLSFASPERLKKYLGLAPGSVSPLGLIHDKNKEVVVLLDRDLLDHESLGFHPNVNTATLVIPTEGFQRFLAHCGNEVRVIDPPAQAGGSF